MSRSVAERELKDSGVDWIGYIPASWEVSPFFSVARQNRRSNKGMVEQNLLSLSYGRIVRKDINTNGGLLPESFETYQIVEPDDLVLRLTDLQNDKRSLRTGMANERGIITSAYLCVTPHGIIPQFFAYAMRAADHRKIFYSMGGGLRQTMKFDDMRRLQVPCPPPGEQSAIIDFLDRETAKIDAVIEKQRALVDGLRRLRASAIEAAVTRGLGFKNSLRADDSKQSGRIPEGWSLIRADRALERVKRAPREDDGVVTAFRDGQVTLRSNRRTEGFTEALQEIGYQGIRKGDLVIHAMDAFAGAIGVSDSDGKASPVVHAYRGKLADPHFMAYVLREASRAGFIQSLAKGIRERSTSFDPASLKKVYIFLPGMEEQRGIAAHMDRETARIDAIIARSERLIELSQERRAALITAAVTGQINIATDTRALEGVA